MKNKNKIIYKSFFLLINILSIFLFYIFINSPFSYQLEDYGHKAFSNGNFKEAYDSFYKAANKYSINEEKSRAYRCAASAKFQIKDYKKSLCMVLKSLNYNNGNKNALNLIGKLLKIKEVIKFFLAEKELNSVYKIEKPFFYNKTGVWSDGNNSGFFLFNKSKEKIKVKLSTIPNVYPLKFVVLRNNKKIFEKEVSENVTLEIELVSGFNNILVKVNKTFVPKNLGINNDERELGFQLKIEGFNE